MTMINHSLSLGIRLAIAFTHVGFIFALLKLFDSPLVEQYSWTSIILLMTTKDFIIIGLSLIDKLKINDNDDNDNDDERGTPQ